MKQRTILLRFTLIVALLLIALDRVHAQDVVAAGAISPEKFILSVTDRDSIILKILELYKGKIKTTQSKVIELDAWSVRDTAVTFRNENNILKFDLYYGTCLNSDFEADWDCDETKQSMIRMDSNLNSILSKNLQSLTNYYGYDLSTLRLQQQSGLSLRLLTNDSKNILEQRIHPDGGLGIPSNVGIGGYQNFSAAEDGKMVATSSGSPTSTSDIQIRPFHSKGPTNTIRVQDFIWDLALSGPIAKGSSSVLAGSLQESNRYLFFVVNRPNKINYDSRLMTQKINNSTGKFIDGPKAFTDFKSIGPGGQNQTVAVTPGGNIVFYTEFDANPSCYSHLLKAQVFDPQTGTKVGPPQFIIGCDGRLNSYLHGINVTRFQ